MTEERWPRAVEEFDKHLSELDWSHQSKSRRAILEAFLRLATENGFNSVSMRMIAKEMAIKAPSLYNHFPDGRDEIVAESLRWHFYKFGIAVLEEVRGVFDPKEGWHRMVHVHLTRQIQLPESDLWDLLVATDQVVHFLPSVLREEVDAWVDLYEALYRAAAEDMGFGPSVQQVKLVMTILEGANRWVTWDGKPRSLAVLVEKANTATLALLELPKD
ncbi:TetR/AcrR family transcriptional regulator [Streptomyces sp. DSM 40750]|uniref:TetR/AcrR family transcriptional regulator n=1 Tax=Streptomyces sp. DSM 40750 TaxID=2801030 RepID=UPI00214AAAAB|nr:TetR/AcrR family transcriptional regulator [Streptomyces sp. DSM 40750]UUU19120.1 TetR/AcrR family transcriptional regulator [Streptomyces sp. DSM 40750]UUU27536.1 TetR/AcrR family transcriptional regulator [Streptomyces sp. DSM 40750]